MLQLDAGDAGGHRPTHAGRIEPRADAGLDHRDIHASVGEDAERGGDQRVEEGGRGIRIGAVHLHDGRSDPLQRLDEFRAADRRPGDPDPLVPVFEMRGSERARADAGRAE